jgi:lipopolysaccharide exporter
VPDPASFTGDVGRQPEIELAPVHAEPGESPGADMRRSAVRGFAWSAVSFGGNKLFVFASTLVLTRLLSPADFGVVAAALAYMAYLEVLLDLGLSAAVVYRQPESRSRTVSTAFVLNMGACLVLGVLNFVFAGTVAQFFHAQDGTEIFRLLSVYILLRGVGAIEEALLMKDMRFREKGIADLVRAFVRGALGIVLAFAGLEARALVLAFLCAELAGVVTTTVMTRFRPSLRFDRGTAVTLLRYGAPVAALALLSELGVNSDYFVVGHVLGPTALGLYTIAFRLPEMLLSNVYWMFSSVAFPTFTKARVSGVRAFRDASMNALRLLTLFAFPVAAGLALVARDSILVLFSEKWSGATTAMELISLTIGLGCLGYASGDAYKAAGRPGTLLWINIVSTAVMVTGFIVAAPYGITAVAAVHLCVNVVYGPVRLALANRLIGTTFADVARAVRPALCITAGVVAAALPVRLLTQPGEWALVAIIAAGCAGGAVGLLAAGARSTLDDVKAVVGALRREPAGG